MKNDTNDNDYKAFLEALRRMKEGAGVPELVPEEEHGQSLDNTHDRAELWCMRVPGNGILGFVDEVNGPESEPRHDFVPTRHELLILARHWAEEFMDVDTSCFFESQSGSSEYRILIYADRRLARLASVLGEETVRQVLSEVKDEYRKRLGETRWAIYQARNTEELDRFCEEARRSGKSNAEVADDSRGTRLGN